jgi:poly-gamma-glutamate synthesis protein (capsule biosynthesis protein)
MVGVVLARRLGWLACLLIFASACALTARPAPTQRPDPASPIPASTPTPTGTPTLYWIQPGVPPELAAKVTYVLEQEGFNAAPSADGAQVQIILNPPASARLTAQIVYALVAPFPTVPDDVSLEVLKALWQNGAAPPGFDRLPAFYTTPDTNAPLEALLGKAGSAPPPAHDDTLLDTAWNTRPSLAVIPFERLEPRWKVLSVDGQSPLDKSLDANAYPLTLKIGLTVSGAEPFGAGDRAVMLLLESGAWPASNRDPAKLSNVVLTGTTALTRATGWMMDHRGVSFPSEKILSFLADADLLHVSNEVSFTPKCPPAELTGDEKFCSSPAYFDLLKTIGLDIVELTGNHNLDYGAAPADYSLDLYDKAGIAHYGGGRNLDDSQTPRILITPDGAKIAFIGCNSAGPFRAWATAQTPGAAPCGDYAWIKAAIADLKSTHKADLVILTLQAHESPSYTPEPKQVTDFEALATAGADIVSGSQAHQPQGFSFAGGKVIHFGVGNLFFDQMDYVQNRQMFADKYVLYGGKVISLVLFTGMNEDYSQPRPMTSEERTAFLKTIFAASGW